MRSARRSVVTPPSYHGSLVPLTSRQARFLRSLAHPLDPVVRVGSAGVTDAVVDKTDKELEIHELLKVKVDAEREGVREAADRLASATQSEVAQVIGKVIILYRKRSKKPTIRLPAAE
jgi:RNA-binding protein